MMVAAIGSAIWTLFDAEAIAVLAVVLWTGLLTWVLSFALRARRRLRPAPAVDIGDVPFVE